MFTSGGYRYFRLILRSGYILDLENTFYIPSFNKSLISITKLAPLGYDFNFSKMIFFVSQNNIEIRYGDLDSGLDNLNLNPNCNFFNFTTWY